MKHASILLVLLYSIIGASCNRPYITQKVDCWCDSICMIETIIDQPHGRFEREGINVQKCQLDTAKEIEWFIISHGYGGEMESELRNPFYPKYHCGEQVPWWDLKNK